MGDDIFSRAGKLIDEKNAEMKQKLELEKAEKQKEAEIQKAHGQELGEAKVERDGGS